MLLKSKILKISNDYNTLTIYIEGKSILATLLISTCGLLFSKISIIIN